MNATFIFCLLRKFGVFSCFIDDSVAVSRGISLMLFCRISPLDILADNFNISSLFGELDSITKKVHEHLFDSELVRTDHHVELLEVQVFSLNYNIFSVWKIEKVGRY